MITQDLTKLNSKDWLIIHIYVDDPFNLGKIKEEFDNELVNLKDKINGWFFLCYTNLKDYQSLTYHRYKLFIWKKSGVEIEEIKQFVGLVLKKDIIKEILHKNSGNPKFDENYVKEDSVPDRYEGICDLYLGCVCNEIRLILKDKLGKELDENAMALLLHFLFNERLKNGYLYDLNVGLKLVTNALVGLKIDPFIRKD